MKRFILGLIVGIAIMSATTVYGEVIIESIVGKTVQGEFPVTIDGKHLDVKAAVLDGTSYAPLRAIGEAIGRDVSFDASKGIELKEKEVKHIKPQTYRKSIVKLDKEYKKESGDFEYIEIDGNKYVSAVTLIDPYKVQRNNNKIVTVSFTLDGNAIELPMNKDYSIGVDSFEVYGISVFNISLLGLTAHVEGDTLIIEPIVSSRK